LGKDHHILTFPIQEGKTMNVVAFISDRTPASKSSEWSGDAWIVKGSREEMMNGWEDWSDDCQKILEVSSHPSLSNT
jgi:salicylate hydroxylase